MAEIIDIVVPDLGEFEDVEVIEILVGAGDNVVREDGLLTLETDKATMDVPAPNSGQIGAISVVVGDTVSSGDVIGTMSVEVGDTVVVSPAINAELLKGDTTVVATPQPVGGGQLTIEVPDLGGAELGPLAIEHVDVAHGPLIDGEAFALELLDHYNVAVAPGPTFGPASSGFVRISLASSEGDIAIGLKAICDLIYARRA